MCEPNTFTAIATGASTLIGGAAQIQAGQTAAATAEYQQKVNNNNAILLRQKADQERAAGDLDEVRKREEIRQIMGQQRAEFGASGVALGGGSPLDVILGTAQQGEIDAQIIRNNAEQRARDLEFEADNLETEGLMIRQAGRAERTGSFLAAGSTLLSGAANLGMFQPRGGSAAKTAKAKSKGK